jgi:hypothetical protein
MSNKLVAMQQVRIIIQLLLKVIQTEKYQGNCKYPVIQLSSIPIVCRQLLLVLKHCNKWTLRALVPLPMLMQADTTGR